MLNLKNVSFSYGMNKILNNVNLSISPGEFLFLIGKSGSGKTTLMKLLYLDLIPDEGTIIFEGKTYKKLTEKDIVNIRRRIGIVFQDFKLLEDRNVFENLNFILEVQGISKKLRREKIEEILYGMAINHLAKMMPNNLSGGEKQRVAIARAMLNNPVLIIADEPTGNLDPETSTGLMEIFNRINKNGTAVIFATHNYELLTGSAKIMRIDSGVLTNVKIKQ
ncbi:MAG: ATP-binding cassette domain-containing protein [Ignavibacteriaceae bacterium]|nr:ATP-binding cassette domain-containing protein [Ignavibacteriaceae bacterium]